MTGQLSPEQIAAIMKQRRLDELAELQAMQAGDRAAAEADPRLDISQQFQPRAEPSLALPATGVQPVAPVTQQAPLSLRDQIRLRNQQLADPTQQISNIPVR